MIRNRADFLNQVWRLLEFIAQLGTFVLINWLMQLVPHSGDAGIIWDVVSAIIAIVLGAVLPSLVLPSPSLVVRWTIDDVAADGQYSVDLRHRTKREFVFRTTLHVTYHSLLGLWTLRRLVAQSPMVTVQFEPSDSARLKRQQSDGRASLDARAARISLPVTSIAHEARQSMFRGSAVTVQAGSTLTYRISASLGSDHSWFIKRFVLVRTEVDGLTVSG